MNAATRISRYAAAAALLACLPGAGRAQAQYLSARFKGRLQTEFRTSDIHSTNADGTPAAVNTVVGNEFFIRRFYVEADVRVAQHVRAKMELNATRRALNLEDAYVDVGLGRFVTWRVGQEKKPVERQELVSSSRYPTVERGAQVAGMRNQNLVSENNFLTAAGFSSHDVGTSLELHTADSAAIPVSLRVGVWTGQGKDNPEVNNAKTFGARLTVQALPRLSLGASFVSHDDPLRVTVGTGSGATQVFAADSAGRSTAFGVDAEWGTDAGGLHVIADASIGREGRLGAFTPTLAGLRASAPGADFSPRFRTLHLVGEYKLAVGGGAVQAIGPLLRFDRTEPDTGNEVGSTLLTPGVNLYFSPNTWLMVNYDVITPGDRLDLGRGAGESVHSFKTMLRIFF
ncbi:MAG TPA: porin [Longimicrobiaceae bacterium]|nr:porin [Longimicrobiaceae bacterium]